MIFSHEQLAGFAPHHFAYLIVEEQNHLLSITLNRPEKKNAMNAVMFREIVYALNYSARNNDIWAVVIAAKGDVFCSGADLKAGPNDEARISKVPVPDKEAILGDAFNSLHKPCIAKVQASVYAGGFLIICGCTHVFSVPEAMFSLPEVKRGLYPFQVMQSMLQIMPARTVLDYCIRAKSLSAVEAQKIGLVNEIFEKDKLVTEVQKLVDEIFQHSPSAIRLGLEAYEHLNKIPKSEAHAYLKQMFSVAWETEDAKEGMKAFAEKRPPVWTGK